MKQYRYILDYDLNMAQKIGEIKSLPEYGKNKGLLQIVEPGCDDKIIQKDLDILNATLENIEIFGMTSHGAISKETHSVEYVVCSLIFFEENNFIVNVYDCSNGLTPSDAGEQFKSVLGSVENVKAVLLMSSDFSLCPEKFIDKINEYDSNLIVFGALAGTLNMLEDESKIFVGDKIYKRGILAITMYGETLYIEHFYNLGFTPLGKELVVTKANDSGVVYEINNKPAFNIYRDHLGVGMNDYFFENTSSFPFALKENGVLLARVALAYHNDGALAFATEIPVGSSVSLSYATTDSLLEEAALNSRKMWEFYPDAILMYVCMSRRMLMGDDMAELELELYENVHPAATWAHGYGEILHADGMRGFLNASNAVIGLREGEIPPENQRRGYKYDSHYLRGFLDERNGGYLPLSVRLINFLESTSADLREAVDQLFKVASMDELTQIYNRRALNYYMNKFIENKSAYSNVAVLMVDIDHFKNVNDTYGHDVGDLVLKNGVGSVKYLFNQADVIGRWGGEEFVGIKPNITKEEALDFCETVRAAVEYMEFETVGHITVSIGLTMIEGEDTDETVFKRIDDALYEAKKTGRNKVVYR